MLDISIVQSSLRYGQELASFIIKVIGKLFHCKYYFYSDILKIINCLYTEDLPLSLNMITTLLVFLSPPMISYSLTLGLYFTTATTGLGYLVDRYSTTRGLGTPMVNYFAGRRTCQPLKIIRTEYSWRQAINETQMFLCFDYNFTSLFFFNTIF